MIKSLNSAERLKLYDLVKIYLTKEDDTEESFEMDKPFQTDASNSITYYHYPAGSPISSPYTINYVQFIVQFLLQKMYKGELFKFNKAMSQAILKADETTAIVNILWESHLEMQAIKQNTAKEIKARKDKETPASIKDA